MIKPTAPEDPKAQEPTRPAVVPAITQKMVFPRITPTPEQPFEFVLNSGKVEVHLKKDAHIQCRVLPCAKDESEPEDSFLGFLGRLCVIVLSVLIIYSMWGSSSFRPSILSKDGPAAKTKTLIRHVTATVTTTLQPSTTTSWATTTATYSLQPSTVTSTMTERVTTKQTKTANTYYIPSPGKFTVQDSKLWYSV
ncbi:hypothetical protein D6C86_03962 [Aureobasidium pullulans]|uniref:Uncharacterized protein n=1 Tax=Aureobasidium pullulans TaxID=5580 RepID=A0A4S9PVX4_AURPU|nr:hypothetical protein D6C94_05765 [Aureobasidium pullulans]THZ41813.1 hypothetical protein D6C87_05445 [Aureobasidium pullulans]THZ62094.1 hypothetical protein D6C86_03962 [Aureobasidium pullulans]TIA36154.1 hypothetical protein D6C78_05611 [Aureobasidium pullulans]